MRILLLCLFLFCFIASDAQQKPWECIQTEGDCCAFAKCITSDEAGNSYVTGWFNSNSVALGSGALKFTSLNSGGNMSIVKYDTKGAVVWAKGTVSSESMPSLSSVIDKDGNSYITGLFGGQSAFDAPPVPGIYRDSSTMTVVKFDTKGHILWQKNEAANSKSTSIAIDKNKNVYVTGWFIGDYTTFGTIVLKNPEMCAKKFFVVKYDPSGNVLWARTTGGKGDVEPSSLVTGPAGNIIITGTFYGNPVFDTTSLKSENDYYDIFIVKYNAEGQLVWGKKCGGSFSDYSTSISVDKDANNYISGYFSGSSMVLDTTKLTRKTPGTMDDFNIFIAKFDKHGNLVWAKSADDSGNGYPDRLAITNDKAGNCYIGGNFDGGNFSFGGSKLSTNCTSTSNFILKLNGSGKVLWLKNLGDGNCNSLASFYVDNKQNCRAIIGSPQSFHMFVFKAN
ncbi:MAG: hypothetical protein WAQ28_12475 [Bacteroidia bacterium]